MGRFVFTLLRMFLLLVLSWGVAQATTIHVPADQPTIQAGIDAVVDGDTVLVAPGVYTGDGNRDIELRGKAIAVVGDGGPDSVVIDCQATEDDRHRGFYIHEGEDTTTVIQGFTLRNGLGGQLTILSLWQYGSAGGSGMAIIGASPVIRDIRFAKLDARPDGFGLLGVSPIGPAIAFKNCRSRVEGCSFLNNGFNRRVAMERSLFGGAIFVDSSDVVFDRCIFLDNKAVIGGVVAGQESNVTFRGCTLARNAAHIGGSFVLVNSNLQIENSVVAYSLRDVLTANANTAVTVQCCNFYGNAGGDYVKEFAAFADINGNISEPPEFCDLRTGDITVFDTSPLLSTNNGCGLQIGVGSQGCISNRTNWYLSPGDSANTIQAAIDLASNGDSIILGPGTYSGTGNRDIDFSGKSIVLKSTDGPAHTTIDCGASLTNRHRGLIFISGENQNCIVQGLTITGAFAPDDYPSRLNNVQAFGGGILCLGGSPTITDCWIVDNAALDLASPWYSTLNGGAGGGIAAEYSSVTVQGCEVSGNRAADGAGVFLRHSPAVIQSCFVERNYGVGEFHSSWTTQSNGGGIWIDSSGATIRNTRVVANFIHGGQTDFPPYPLYGNGAGVYIKGSSTFPVVIENCTVVDNGVYQRTDAPSGLADFPAIYTSTFSFGWSQVSTEVRNSIVLGPVVGVPLLSCSSLDDWKEDIVDQLGVNGNFNADPKFCFDYSLYEDSPCAPENSPCGELVGSEPVGCVLECGNVNSDVNGIDILDLVYLVDYAFRNGPAPLDKSYADVDGSGDINIADINYLVSYLFRSGPAPVCR